MQVFNRTATGDANPIAWVPGPGGNQFAVYNGMILVPRQDNIYAWSLKNPDSSGRPLWKIPAPLGPRANQLGIALDPAHKEILVATGEGNQIRTFSVPEFFTGNNTN